MKNIDLLAIVLDLRPNIERPVQAANWYGRAAQALVYECIGNYDPAYAEQLHKIDEECKPFTTTTLIGSFPKGQNRPAETLFVTHQRIEQKALRRYSFRRSNPADISASAL